MRIPLASAALIGALTASVASAGDAGPADFLRTGSVKPLDTTAARATLDRCLDQSFATGDDPMSCRGSVAALCGGAASPACLDEATAIWDAVADDAAVALSSGRETDQLLMAEARDDVMASRRERCAAASGGDAAKAAACQRDRAAERAVVFRMMLSLDGLRR